MVTRLGLRSHQGGGDGEDSLMRGAADNRFCPLSNLSREEAMALVERLIVQYGY